MDILLDSVGESFDGVRLTEKWFKVRNLKKGKKNAIAAKIVEHWLNEPKNKLTILNLSLNQALYGTGIGTLTATGFLSPVSISKFFASPVIRSKQGKKTRLGEKHGRANRRNTVSRERA